MKTKEYRGWIYCITNKINGKRYIGQTVNYKQRMREHFQYFNCECSALHSAITKYGSENFDVEIIVTFNAVNREVCKSVLDQLEIYYIKHLKTLTHQKGYNVNAGGKGNMGYYPSEETRKVLSTKKKTQEALEHLGRVRPDNRRKVLMYDLEGKFLMGHESIISAVKYCGKNTSNGLSGITKALKSSNHHFCGHLWRYEESDDFPLFVEPYKDKRTKTVFYYGVNGQLLGKYPSTRRAAELTGIPIRTINNSLEGEQRGRKRKSNYWSHIPPSFAASK